MIDFKPILDKDPNIIERPVDFANEFYNLYPDNEVIFDALKKYNFSTLFIRAFRQKLINKKEFTITLSNYKTLTSIIDSDSHRSIIKSELCRGIFYLILIAKGYSVIVEDDQYYLSIPLEKDDKKNHASKNIEQTPLHQHIDKVYTISPTCITQKHDIHICKVCGRSYTDSFDMEGDHVYEVVDHVDPKCNRKGYEIKKCILCGYEEKTEYQETPHKFTDWFEKDHPTCSNSGLRVRECKDCGLIEEDKIEALGHSFSEWIEKDNFKTRVCKNCGEKESIDLIKEEKEKKKKAQEGEMIEEEVSEKDKKKLISLIAIVSSMFIIGAILLIIDGIRIYFNGIIHNYLLTAIGYGLVLIPGIFCFFSFEYIALKYKNYKVFSEGFRFVCCIVLGIFGFCLLFNNFFNMIVLKRNYDLLTNGGTPMIITILLRSAPIVLVALAQLINLNETFSYSYDTSPVFIFAGIIIATIALLILLVVFAIINHLFGSWLFWGGVIACILNGFLTYILGYAGGDFE